MRKALIFVLVIVLMISYVGCETIDKNDTVSSKINTLDTNKYIGLKESCKKIKWNCEIKLDKIIDFSRWFGYYFIDIDGNLYQYTKNGKLFSNNKNYKKIISDKKIARFLGRYVISYDNKIGMIFENQVEFEDFDHNGSSTNEVKLIQNLLDNNSNLVNFSYGYYPYAYVQNLEIYATNPWLTLMPDILIGVLQSDEKFIGGYGDVIKTDKNYYYSDIVNQDELNKYEDAEREYGFLRMESVSDAYEEILYYNGDKIFFKDDNEYIYYLR